MQMKRKKRSLVNDLRSTDDVPINEERQLDGLNFLGALCKYGRVVCLATFWEKLGVHLVNEQKRRN